MDPLRPVVSPPNGPRSPSSPSSPPMLKVNGSLLQRHLSLDTSKHSLGGSSSFVVKSGPEYSREYGAGSPPLGSDLSPKDGGTRLGLLPSPTPSATIAIPAILDSGGGGGSTGLGSPTTLWRHRDVPGTRVLGTLVSLALLAVVSILVATLAIVFLLKVTQLQQMHAAAALVPESGEGASTGASGKARCNVLYGTLLDPEDYKLVIEVVIGLTTCTASLDLSCLLICTAQFLFAAKLMKTMQEERVVVYLSQCSYSRGVAISGFFVSIPVLLTAIILYAFIHFDSKPAIVTSLIIGLAIVFCGFAMIHSVYVWQKEKTKATLASLPRVKSVRTTQNAASPESADFGPMELSTLV